MDRVIKEAIEIKLHANIINRDGGFNLSRSWYPIMNMLKQYRRAHFRIQDQAKQTLDESQKGLDTKTDWLTDRQP
jgi:hypothetical protein